MLTSRWIRKIGLAATTAILAALSLPPFDVWALMWFAVVPLLVAIRDLPPRQSFALGLFSGTVLNYAGFHWCVEMMREFSALGPLSYLVMLAMALYQGVIWGVWCAALRWPHWRGPVALRYSASAAAFVALEFFYPIVFPWYLANSQYTRPEVTSVVELAGVSLLSLLIVLVNLGLARAFLELPGESCPGSETQGSGSVLWPLGSSGRARWAPLLLAAVAMGSALFWHAVRAPMVERALADSDRLRIGMVQPNHWIGRISPEDGLADYQRLTFGLVQEQNEEGTPLDLVLWPESAVLTRPPEHHRKPAEDSELVLEQVGALPRYPVDATWVRPDPSEPEGTAFGWPPPSPSARLAVQRGHDVPILFGTTTYDPSPSARGPIPGRPPAYNSALLLGSGGEVLGSAPKVKLLLFGETIPFSNYFPQVYRLLPLASALLPGEAPTVLDFLGHRLGVMICYEDLLPWFHYDLAKGSPQVLLNLTNDAWFGKTAEAAAHLALAQLRAVEGRVYLLRSTTTGISAVVDPFGRVVAAIPQDEVGTLAYSVALSDIETLFERYGDTVAWGALLGCLALLAFSGWSKTRRP